MFVETKRPNDRRQQHALKLLKLEAKLVPRLVVRSETNFADNLGTKKRVTTEVALPDASSSKKPRDGKSPPTEGVIRFKQVRHGSPFLLRSLEVRRSRHDFLRIQWDDHTRPLVDLSCRRQGEYHDN